MCAETKLDLNNARSMMFGNQVVEDGGNRAHVYDVHSKNEGSSAENTCCTLGLLGLCSHTHPLAALLRTEAMQRDRTDGCCDTCVAQRLNALLLNNLFE